MAPLGALRRGEIPRGPLPTLIPWRPLARVTNVLGPIAAAALAALVIWGATQLYPPRSSDDSVPAGVWAVQEDTAAPAEQLGEDRRWARIAFGAGGSWRWADLLHVSGIRASR